MKNRSVVKFNDDFIRNGLFEMKFEEIEKLGEGGYGQVFKVRERYSLRREARSAIKKMEFKEKIVLEFLKELKTSAIICEFNNQNLIRYSDVWLEKIKLNFVLFIQMEICDKPLTHIINEINRTPELKSNDFLTPLGYYIACEIFIEILEGVEYLHENNTIHRDLKPDNILLIISENKKFVKIADFGLLALHKYAIEVKNQNKVHKYAKYSHTTEVGDWNYAAPEVLDGRIYDTRADLYSLGVILQELFCIPEDGYKK
jgi:serine/threonine protein kinase